MLEIISIALILIIGFIIFFWLKKTLFIFGFFFKIFAVAFLGILAVSILFGYFIVKDATDFSSNFGNSTSMFVLKDTVNGSEKFLTGVFINPESSEFKTMNDTELLNTERLYKSNILNTIGDKYYKIFIVDFKSFNDMNIAGVEDKNINLSKEDIRTIMLSDDAKDNLAKIIANYTGKDEDDIIKDLKIDDNEIKSYIFTYYLSTTFDPSNMGRFLSSFKDDNVLVYENTAMFKAIKVIPTFLINSVMKKVQESVYEASSDNVQSELPKQEFMK